MTKLQIFKTFQNLRTIPGRKLFLYSLYSYPEYKFNIPGLLSTLE